MDTTTISILVTVKNLGRIFQEVIKILDFLSKNGKFGTLSSIKTKINDLAVFNSI